MPQEQGPAPVQHFVLKARLRLGTAHEENHALRLTTPSYYVGWSRSADCALRLHLSPACQHVVEARVISSCVVLRAGHVSGTRKLAYVIIFASQGRQHTSSGEGALFP